MSAFNPFRKSLVGGAPTTSKASSTAQSTNAVPTSLTSNAAQAQQPFTPAPSDYPKSLSPKIEEDDSTSSDEQADPFNPDSSTSDNEDSLDLQNLKRSTAGDHSRDSFGSTPHPAPSTDGSATTPSEAPLPAKQDKAQSIASSTESDTEDDTISSTSRTARLPPADKQATSPPSRTGRDKKPPPPPRSHHGKRISVAGDATTAQSVNKSNNRLSFHSSSPESLASVRPIGTPNASTQPPALDYFSTPSDNQGRVASGEALSRDSSQQRRPPTPPLSRRRSQMQRSKSTQSTQSRSNVSRLTMSSVDSESNDGSQPPSPGLSTRSGASTRSRDHKRISMPPTSSTATSAGVANHLSPPIDPQPLQPGRRASSYGNIATGSSSTVPPPPPPPRRARDPSARGGEGRPLSMIIPSQEEPLPQPSNAHDILADLSRLQKEVDDLRGHYESRKVSQ